jgi:hypothetical protein
MKNKSFSNKLEELKSTAPAPHEVEKKLLPRLKFMGYVMYALCLVSFSYAIAAKEETETVPPSQGGVIDPESTEAVVSLEMLSEEGELELSPTEVLNFYFVALIFAAVGTSCFLIAWKKRKKLFQEN